MSGWMSLTKEIGAIYRRLSCNKKHYDTSESFIIQKKHTVRLHSNEFKIFKLHRCFYIFKTSSIFVQQRCGPQSLCTLVFLSPNISRIDEPVGLIHASMEFIFEPSGSSIKFLLLVPWMFSQNKQ